MQLLDLYEAVHRYGYRLDDFSGESISQIYWRAFNRSERFDRSRNSGFAENRWSDFRSVGWTHLSLNDLKPVKVLPEVNDEGAVNLPKSCRLMQLAYWDDRLDSGRVRESLWNRLDNANRAAVYLHEFYWRGERRYGANAETSEWVRRKVAKHFSIGQIFPYVALPDGKPRLQCTAYPEKNGGADRGRYLKFTLWSGVGGFLTMQIDAWKNRQVHDEARAIFSDRVGDIDLRSMGISLSENNRFESGRGVLLGKAVVERGAWQGKAVEFTLNAQRSLLLRAEGLDFPFLTCRLQEEKNTYRSQGGCLSSAEYESENVEYTLKALDALVACWPASARMHGRPSFLDLPELGSMNRSFRFESYSYLYSSCIRPRLRNQKLLPPLVSNSTFKRMVDKGCTHRDLLLYLGNRME